ncbi:archaea-specific SMC-related protein [Halorientalis brevis]|uniref:Archaea-specific SMC-related protein n=1 Tax=Halorientalis brevis TaxID=1126241 RepID=A0ABD6CDL5_9EURY|nr:archaea-specific SMC-related protein [Halorientalis brevis]
MNSVGTTSNVAVAVENVGGIEEESLSFAPGVTVLTGKNATNRTSLLQSLMAAVGSDNVSLKSDAEQGEVTLSLDGETYTRTLVREDGRIRTSGDPYLDDAELADLFAFLLESNEARQAVRRGADLRELIMRPVDTDAIRAEIERLEAEKRRLDDELAELADLEEELPGLEERRTNIESDIADQEATLEQKRSALDALDASLEDSKEKQEQLDAKLTELETARTDLEGKQTRLSTERASIESLREERTDLEADLDDVPDGIADRIDQLDAELDRVREHKQSLDATITQLGQVIQFNESVVDGESDAVLDALDADGEGESVTDQLLADDGDVVCWTCGSEVAQSSITNTLETLRTLRQEKVTVRRDCQADIDELQAEKRDLEDERAERERLQRRLDDVDDEIEQRQEAVATLESEIESLEATIEELEAAVQQRESEQYDDVLERHREVNEAEFELESLQDDLADVEAEIERIEAEIDRRSDLEDRRESVAAELTEQRTKIDRLEADVVDIFNEEMAAVLSLLDYDNIERIWIERRERESGGRRTETEHVFDLHVVRGSTDGAAYEDRIEHLSESEREVAGLVFALAGYLAHDVYESVPFMLLDSLEAIDAERIADLIEYLSEYTPNLVVALLETDAAAVDQQYERIEMGA